jgi:hypothetical protein
VKALITLLEPASWTPGAFLGRAHWIIPVSPSRAIAITPTHAPNPPSANAALVDSTNRQMFLDARRYVFSRSFVEAERFGAGR